MYGKLVVLLCCSLAVKYDALRYYKATPTNSIDTKPHTKKLKSTILLVGGVFTRYRLYIIIRALARGYMHIRTIAEL